MFWVFMCACIVFVVSLSSLFLFWEVWSQERIGRRIEEGRRRGEGEDRRRGDSRMGVQVLLLRDPGAELGWAGLSDTLPSAGGERESTSDTHTCTYTQFSHPYMPWPLPWARKNRSLLWNAWSDYQKLHAAMLELERLRTKEKCLLSLRW